MKAAFVNVVVKNIGIQAVGEQMKEFLGNEGADFGCLDGAETPDYGGVLGGGIAKLKFVSYLFGSTVPQVLNRNLCSKIRGVRSVGLRRILRPCIFKFGTTNADACLLSNLKSSLGDFRRRLSSLNGSFVLGQSPIHDDPLQDRGEQQSTSEDGDKPIRNRGIFCLVCLALLFPAAYYGESLVNGNGRRWLGWILIWTTLCLFWCSLALLCLSNYSWSWGWWL